MIHFCANSVKVASAKFLVGGEVRSNPDSQCILVFVQHVVVDGSRRAS